MRTSRTIAAAALALGLIAAGCGGDDDDNAGDTTVATTGASDTTGAASDTTTGGVTPAGPPIKFKSLDAGGPLTVAALQNGDIQIGLLFTSDGAIAANELVLLEDDKQLQPVENLVLVGRQDKITAPVTDLIKPVFEVLTTEELTEMNRQMNVDKKDPADVAKEWLDKGEFLVDGTSLDGLSFTVGSSNFNEQELISSMVSQLLTANGADVSEKFGIGSREVVAPALEGGDIDLYVEYVGSYLTYLGGTPTTNLEESLAALAGLAGPKGVAIGPVAPAEDKNGFVVTKETAEKYGLTMVSDLAKVTDQLTLGGPPECPERPLCIGGLESVYGLQFDV